LHRLKTISIIIILTFVSNVFAATITWDGSTDTDWATSANWDAGVPTITDDVIVPGSLSNYPDVNETASALSLAIASGATVTISTSAALTVAGDIDITGTLKVDAGTLTTAVGMNINVLNGGSFDLNGGTVNASANFRTEIGSTTDISGGTLDIGISWNRASSYTAAGTITLSAGTIDVGKNCSFASTGITGTMSGTFVLTVGNIFRNTTDDWTVTGGTVVMDGSYDTASKFYTTDAAVDLEVWNLTINTADPAHEVLFANFTGNGVIIGNNFTLTSGTVIIDNEINHSDHFQVDGTFSMGADGHFKDAYLDADTYTVNTFSFNASSTYELNSITAQTLGSSRSASYGNLIINNSSGVSLGQAITVNGALTLTSGLLTTTNTNLLTMGSASSVSGGSVSSFVNGPLSNTWPASGSINKTFPLGKDATYRPLDISLSTAGSQVMMAELFNADAGGSKGSLGDISTVRYYQTSVTTGTIGSVATAKLTFGGDDNVTNTSELLVGQSTTLTGTYVSLGMSANTASTVTSNAFDPTEAGEFLLLATSGNFAANYTWTGATDTDWATASNWDVGVPSLAENVIIPGSLSNYPDINEAAVCINLTIESGGMITLSSGGTLSPSSDVSLTGTLQVDAGTVTIASGKDILVNSSGLLDLNAGTFYAGGGLAISSGGKVTVGGTAALTTSDSISVSDTLRIDAGTVITSSGVNIFVDNGGFIDLNGGTLDDGGALTIASGGTVNTSGTSTLTTDDQIDITGTLQIDAGTLTTASGMSMTINSGGVFDLNGGDVTVGGDFNTEAGSTTDISSGTFDITGSWSRNDETNARGTITLSGGTIDVANSCFFDGSNLTGIMSGSFVLTVGNNFKNNTNNWTVTGGTLAMDASFDGGATIFRSNTSYDVEVWNLTINSSTPTDVFDLSNLDDLGIIVRNDFTLTSGTVITHNGSNHSDHFQVDGTFIMGADGHFKDAYLDGDTYTVNAFSFNAASTYELNSTTAQALGSSRSASYGNLTMNNSSGVSLAQAITVNGDLTLTDGILTSTSTNLLTLGSTSSVSGGSDVSFVNGPMSSTWPASGSINKTFPLGKDATYRPLDISLSSSASQVMKAELFNADAGGSKGSLGDISTVRYYQTSVTTGTIGSVATAKITYGDDDNVSNSSELLVGQSTTLTGTYVSLGMSANTANTVTSNTFDPTEAGELLLLATSGNFAINYTWDGSTDTDWATAANWDVGVPSSSDNVIIPGSLSNYPDINEAASCINLTIASGAMVTISTSGTLDPSNDVSLSGTLQIDAGTVSTASGTDFSINSGGLLDLNGGLLAISGALTVSNSAQVTMGGTASLTTAGDLTIEDTLQLDSGSITTASGMNIIVNSGGFLDVNGGSVDIGGLLTIPSGGKVALSGSSVLTPADDIDVTGILLVDAGTITTASDKDISVYSLGLFDLNGGTVNIGGNFQTESGSTVDIAGGTLDIAGSWKRGGAVDAKGTISLSGGAIDVASDCFFSDNNVTGTMSGTFVLTVGNNFKNSADNWTVTGGTVVMDASLDGTADLVAITSNYDVEVWNLTLNGNPGDEFIFANATGRGIVVGNNFTLTSGTVISDDGANHADHFQVDGTFTMGTNGHFKDAYLDADTYTVNAFSFNAASTYEFNSSTAQTVSSSRPSSFGNLIVNKSTDLSLGQAITVNGTLTMTDGLLTTTDTNLLTMGSSSSISGGSDSSFVNGPMSNTWPASGTINKTFPLGKDASYRPLDISLSSSGSQVMKAELFNAATGGNTLTLNAISLIRYYETSVTSGTVGNVASAKITFGADDSVQTPATLVVARSTTQTGEYFNLGNSAYSDSTVSSDTYDPTEAGDFLLLGSTGDNSLPVELSLFAARQEKNTIKLEWITESEIENLGFILERQESEDENWQEIGSFLTHSSMEGKGSSTKRTNYSFMDEEIKGGKTYSYRLADVNYQGEKVYHDLTNGFITVGELIPTTFELNDNYPNPFNPSTTIHYGLPEDAQISLVIYDILGREVSTLVSEVQEAGWYDVRWYGLDESGRPMSAGIYLLRIQTQNFVEVKRMILVR